MKLFELRWTWYEDYSPHLFFAQDKTEEDFHKDCEDIAKTHFDDFIKQEGYYDKKRMSFIGYDSLVEFIASKLPEYGYEPAVKEGVYGFFGSTIFKDRDSDLKDLLEVAGKENVQKAIKHNKAVDRNMNKRIKRINNET